MNDPDDDLDAATAPLFVEPWIPEIGQWVRLRVSLECAYRDPQRVDIDRFDGQIGIVTVAVEADHMQALAQRQPDLFDAAHRFGVHIPACEATVRAAAIELEPLDLDDTEARTPACNA